MAREIRRLPIVEVEEDEEENQGEDEDMGMARAAERMVKEVERATEEQEAQEAEEELAILRLGILPCAPPESQPETDIIHLLEKDEAEYCHLMNGMTWEETIIAPFFCLWRPRPCWLRGHDHHISHNSTDTLGLIHNRRSYFLDGSAGCVPSVAEIWHQK
ncbi:MAG: hypothetical protein Q9200_000030 [Gallowayella weberi]